MAGTANQKLKTLFIMRLLTTETDCRHGVTMEQIITYLRRYGITAERKSVYTDLELLRTFGLDIGTRRSKQTEYMLMSRDFQLPELKLLVDAVGASRFITRKKSLELIKKLGMLTSNYEAAELKRQVYVDKRVKMMNESIYYSIDGIHKAINDRKKISFKYFDYAIDKQRVLRRNGADYMISPLALLYADENYYLAAYAPERGAVSNYRVDRMTDVRILEEDRDDNEVIRSFNPATYINMQFSMFGGYRQKVDLEFDNSLTTIVLDRFGTDVMMRPSDSEHFMLTVDVEVSPAFFSWVFMFGARARIVGPENVSEAFANMLRSVSGSYPQGSAPAEMQPAAAPTQPVVPVVQPVVPVVQPVVPVVQPVAPTAPVASVTAAAPVVPEIPAAMPELPPIPAAPAYTAPSFELPELPNFAAYQPTLELPQIPEIPAVGYVASAAEDPTNPSANYRVAVEQEFPQFAPSEPASVSEPEIPAVPEFRSSDSDFRFDLDFGTAESEPTVTADYSAPGGYDSIAAQLETIAAQTGFQFGSDSFLSDTGNFDQSASDPSLLFGTLEIPRQDLAFGTFNETTV